MPRRAEVDRWFRTYDNPMKDVVLAIREVILGVDPRVDECIKWQAPTFTFEGNIASFFPKSKAHASLMFHQGASIPGKHPLLQGSAAAGRSVKLASVAEVKAARKQLEAIIRAWIAWKEGGAPAKKAAKTVAAKKAAKKTEAKKRAAKKPAAKAKLAKKVAAKAKGRR